MNRRPEILIVGAGPAGLALALQAHDHGASIRIVERRPEAFRPSRALIMHPRTLEALRPLGVTEGVVARANVAPEARLHLGRRVVPFRLAKLALSGTAFPHLSLVRQTDVESVLAQALSGRGVDVERGTELLGLENGTQRARARLRSLAGIEDAEFDFVVGCDGQESTVRRLARIGWPGGPYKEEVILADLEVEAQLDEGVAHVVAGRRGLLFLFSIGERATWRLLATRPAAEDGFAFGQPGPAVPQDELQRLINEAGLEARITDLVWSARYRLQHRLASHFRKGRLFLAGDAAHAHSPATGQGMNTSIQDAVNLGWKLALASGSSDVEMLLDSYEAERRPFSRRLLRLTHLAFLAEASSNPLLSAARGILAPLGASVAPALIHFRPLVAEVIRVMSQWRMGYPRSTLSVEGVPRLLGGPRAGYRLADGDAISDGAAVRLHALLAEPGVHILVARDAARIEDSDHGALVKLHRLANMPGKGVIAVRPDGYIGFRCAVADEVQLGRWLASIGAGGQVPGSRTSPRAR